MKYILYRNNKFIMERKYFYPVKSHLKNLLGMKNLMVLSFKEWLETAEKNGYRLEVGKNARN